ncbi:MAG TPA: polymer-forming cytoskeletal protein [Spirochaetota bacterium]|nr:polymer-forming cytoskeletal protein [Spirochaetota bacterium]HOM38604.1 polymer-forming cytoskeletal protein [Spirochaetota bacterium]HPQ49741.1 polymer-forming cytoskeletal protein [Spirochaetota bacterium]
MNYFIEGREEIKSIISYNNTLEGELEFKKSIKINGTFRGTIKGEGLLFIDKDGNVNADIVANEIIIAGKFNGSIIAKSKVEIDETAEVRGSIDTYKLKVADGATLEATCNMYSQEDLIKKIKEKYNMEFSGRTNNSQIQENKKEIISNNMKEDNNKPKNRKNKN